MTTSTLAFGVVPVHRCGRRDDASGVTDRQAAGRQVNLRLPAAFTADARMRARAFTRQALMAAGVGCAGADPTQTFLRGPGNRTSA